MLDLPKIKNHAAVNILSKYSAAVLARRLEISTSYFYSIMRGENPPSPSLQIKLDKLIREVKTDEKLV